MNDSPTSDPQCPRCGAALPAQAPEGLCPRCLAALQLGPETALSGEPQSPALPPLSPEEIAPHFAQLEILECLGRGGMGVVYKARQKSLNRLVALKLLAPERSGDADFARRFTREAHALAALNHPHIVTIYDFGRAGGFYFLLMEFVDGVNLRQAMNAKRFTPEQALTVVPPVCEALQYAHEHGIVHRDIKPENLLLDKDGRVKIADFGVAKMLHDDASGAVAESQPAGTPQYMAPEQRDHQHTDHRTDIYSLGVVLYELLTGERPKENIEPPSKRVQVDVRIDEIVLRALEKAPEMRYQTAGEFRTQLETVTRPSPSQGDTPSGPVRQPWLAPTLVFALIYVVYAGFVASSSSSLPENTSTHFDINGHPNGWMSRSGYRVWATVFPLFWPALFWLVSRCAIRFPALVNIPRRDYWLAPERRAETAALLLGRLLWLACGLTLFFGLLHALVVQANRLSPPQLSSGPLLALIIGFFIVVMIWIVTLIMRLAEAEHWPVSQGGPQASGPLTAPQRFAHTLGFHRPWSQRLLALSFLGFLGFLGCIPGCEWMLGFLSFFVLLAVASTVERLSRDVDQAGRSVPPHPWRKLGAALILAVAIGLPMKMWVIAPFTVVGDSAAPEIPAGSRILVSKTARSFTAGDMIAYVEDLGGHAYVGRVVGRSREGTTVNRNGRPDVVVPMSHVIGKVISVYWRGTAGVSPAATRQTPGSSPADAAPSASATVPLSQQGWQLWQAGRFHEAATKFSEAVHFTPNDANVWNGLGWASFNSGQTAEAGKAFAKAIELEPGYAAALNGLGQIFLSQREYEKAEPLLLKAAAQPGATAAWYGLARLYLIQGKFAEAEMWAQRVVDSGQGDAVAAKMLEAAKEKHLSEGLRQTIEPPVPANVSVAGTHQIPEGARMVFLKKFTLDDRTISPDTKLVDDARGVRGMAISGESGDSQSRQLEALLQTLGDAHPHVKEIRSRIAARAQLVAQPRVVKLYEVADPMVKLDEAGNGDFDHCTVLYRARVSTKDLTGRVYLEMWCRFHGLGEAFSRGFDQTLTGTNDRRLCQIPFFLKKGERPELIRLNVVIEGEGEVFVKDVELVAAFPEKTP